MDLTADAYAVWLKINPELYGEEDLHCIHASLNIMNKILTWPGPSLIIYFIDAN